MTQDPGADEAWKAPYVSYDTLRNFLENKLGDASTIPPRIDNHFLDSYAGSVRNLLLIALKSAGLLGEQNQVLEPLRQAVAGPDARKRVLREWAETFYAEQIQLALNNETSGALWESFQRHGYSGSTMRKAVVFYLALCDDVGLPKSPHFKAPRQPPPGSSASRKPRSAGRNVGKSSGTTPAAIQGALVPPPTVGETKTYVLGDAGSVTVTVGVRWLDLDEDSFTKLRKAIKDIESLAVTGSTSAPAEEVEL